MRILHVHESIMLNSEHKPSLTALYEQRRAFASPYHSVRHSNELRCCSANSHSKPYTRKSCRTEWAVFQPSTCTDACHRGIFTCPCHTHQFRFVYSSLGSLPSTLLFTTQIIPSASKFALQNCTI